MKRYRFLFFLLFLTSCKKEFSIQSIQPGDQEAWQEYYARIPDLRIPDKEKEYTVRVLRVIDSRLPVLSEEKRKQLYQKIEKGVLKYLGYRIRLVDTGQKDILEFFKSFEADFQRPEFRYWASAYTLNLQDEEDLRRLKDSIYEEMKARGYEIVKKYLPSGQKNPAKTLEEASQFYYDNFLQKQRKIGAIATNDGPFRKDPYTFTQQYMHWSTLLMNLKEADLIITNSMIAGADDGMPVYVINRGGITSALTENNIFNELQGTIALTLFPFLSEDEFFINERGKIPDEEKIDTIAMMGVHEFGHLLGRYREYYDKPGTPFNAPRGLDYYGWYRQIKENSRSYGDLETLDKY